MTGPVELANTAFRNAACFEVRHHRLPSCGPVDLLGGTISRLLREIEDAGETPSIFEFRASLARLRSTVLSALVPFGDPGLLLGDQVAKLKRGAPELQLEKGVAEIEELVRHLSQMPTNPKRDLLFRLIEGHSDTSGGAIGVIVRSDLVAGSGRSRELLADLRRISRRVQLVPSRKALATRPYGRLLLTWGGRRCVFLEDLHYAFYGPILDVLTYACERMLVPECPPLPPGATLSRRRSLDLPQADPVVDSPGEDVEASEAYWRYLRGNTPDANGRPVEQDDRVFVLPGRLVLLANHTKVFLKEGSRVIELSDILDGASPGERFPRVLVANLRPGDLIVLRTSGSGDYLESVADALMRRAGEADLRARALDWKTALARALEEHGSAEIATRLAARGHAIESHHRYLWAWTTNDVIAPREARFYELLAILQELGFLGDEALEVAERKWRETRRIIYYHHKAGVEIRKALLEQLRKTLAQGETVTDCLTLRLLGVDAGELSVLRVAAVDAQTVLVPYNDLGVVTPVPI